MPRASARLPNIRALNARCDDAENARSSRSTATRGGPSDRAQLLTAESFEANGDGDSSRALAGLSGPLTLCQAREVL
jgi:hypothetical protein